uniref:Olfactory receptor n=1 Tax=Canis lupus familiaris TaxID=9615 RepID=A0A8C0MZ80_CANLF
MPEVTNTTQAPFYFILTGIPGFEAFHIWISIPFCCLYTISIVGNTTILAVIRTEPSLHQPMYLFLSMLALTDLGLTLTTLPTVMQLLWFNIPKISFEACFAQFFFLHGFSFMESSVLLAMSFDRYVAICCPLHYATILTSEVIGRIGLAIIGRCILAVLPSLFLLKRLPFCHSHLLSHSYCLHQDMIRLVCADIRVNSWYGFALVLLIIRLRALNNCLSHILAVLVLYVPMIGVSMTHRFAKHASPLVHVIMANVYLLAPPVMNPIIYSVKTKQIRQGIFHVLFQRKVY